MKYCTNCGTKLEDSVQFCTECGAPAPNPLAYTPAEAPLYKTKAASAPAASAIPEKESTGGKSRKALWIVIAVAAVIVGMIIGAVFCLKRPTDNPRVEATKVLSMLKRDSGEMTRMTSNGIDADLTLTASVSGADNKLTEALDGRTFNLSLDFTDADRKLVGFELPGTRLNGVLVIEEDAVSFMLPSISKNYYRADKELLGQLMEGLEIDADKLPSSAAGAGALLDPELIKGKEEDVAKAFLSRIDTSNTTVVKGDVSYTSSSEVLEDAVTVTFTPTEEDWLAILKELNTGSAKAVFSEGIKKAAADLAKEKITFSASYHKDKVCIVSLTSADGSGTVFEIPEEKNADFTANRLVLLSTDGSTVTLEIDKSICPASVAEPAGTPTDITPSNIYFVIFELLAGLGGGMFGNMFGGFFG